MKKNPLIILFLAIFSISHGQTLFTYGKYPVSKDEFLRAYNKNKSTGGEKPLSVKEYLDLYVKFKLKVQAAKDMQLDTLASIKSEMETSNTQIETNLMQDDNEINALVKEAFQRSQKDLHVQHFYIPINNKMLPADTVKAIKAINEIYDELKNGKSGYDEIVSEVSEKIYPAKGNDLGWITVFTLPYDYENIAYNLKAGQVSKPYRTKGGWHVFKLEDERPAAGKITIAQILLAFPENNNSLRDHAKQLADSVYNALQNGADFGQMALKYSNDRRTYMNNGILPEFGVAAFDGAFEKEAFALQHDGDICKPFQTSFGFHILKRISKNPIPATADEAYLSALKQQVVADSRISVAKEKFLSEVLKKTGFKKNAAVSDADLNKFSDSLIVANKKNYNSKLNEKTVLFSFNNGEKVTTADWVQYLKNSVNNQSTVHELMKNYISAAALENYRKRLHEFSPEYNYETQEFKDGEMFFEVMERNVWSKAAADSVGLLDYYNNHKDNYKWNESADAVLFSCANVDIAKSTAVSIKNKSWQEVVKDDARIQADSGRYELTQIPVNNKITFAPNMITDPVVNSSDGTAVFSYIINLHPANEQRNFKDAKGLVINDYQNVLEKKWLDELSKKYPLKVNNDVLKSIDH